MAWLIVLGPAQEDLRTQSFDRDPGWDGRNNRSRTPESRAIRQDFGYGADEKAVGGFVTPAAEPAWYAKPIPERTLKERFGASGTMTVADGPGNVLVGFFNAGTVNEWRTPSSIALRINARGEGFHVHLEYATARWRAGADFYGQPDAKGKKQCRLFPGGRKAYRWSLEYDPQGNSGGGRVTATIEGETLVQNLDPGHKEDGGTFNRFGLLNVMKSADSGGVLWLKDLSVDGKDEALDRDPGWEGRDNRRSYTTENIRPRFDFGFSATRHAGGKAAGEMGGRVFRGDERYPTSMAYYGDRLDPLTLAKPLKASGKISLRRGVTDSTVLIGFFHSADSMKVSRAQVSGWPENFLGVAVEGPSREGFLFYPAYSVDREGEGGYADSSRKPPYIHPDGTSHDWTLEYSPEGNGRITVSLDGRSVRLDLTAAHRAVGARFDRFGIVTTHIDGNAQDVYVDDLTYTWKQP